MASRRSNLRTSPRRILLVRLSAIGDIVFASPLIASLRRAYPNAQIAWLVQPESASLLAHHPDLDQVIAWPLPRWRQLWRQRQLLSLFKEVLAAIQALRAERFDLALDLQGLLKSALPVRWSGAPERIGLGSREGGQWLMTRRLERGPDSNWISSEYRHLASSLGWPINDFRLRIYPGAEAESRAAAWIAEHGLEAGYAVICPFTTRPQKHWFDERWNILARRIHAQFGLPTLMLGGPADVAAARSILAGSASTGHPAPLLSLVGSTSLLSAAALIERARILVGVDTGLSHMGIAFERPSVLLFGSTCPYTETGSARARVLYHRRDCSPCRRRPTCGGAFSCMREIEVDEVMTSLAELLDPANQRMQADLIAQKVQADSDAPSVSRV
ncbi:MAG: lipopolysaccharide heptosyltransferase [Halochromatium sp.]|nr:lipopolysaccharide heptosyltransferase [Halochromatium sp.]